LNCSSTNLTHHKRPTVVPRIILPNDFVHPVAGLDTAIRHNDFGLLPNMIQNKLIEMRCSALAICNSQGLHAWHSNALMMYLLVPGALLYALEVLFNRYRFDVIWANGHCKMLIRARPPWNLTTKSGYPMLNYSAHGFHYSCHVHELMALVKSVVMFPNIPVGSTQWVWTFDGAFHGDVKRTGIHVNHLTADLFDVMPEHLSFDMEAYNSKYRVHCEFFYCECPHTPRCRKYFHPVGNRCGCHGHWDA
jgi:hypothetical protein